MVSHAVTGIWLKSGYETTRSDVGELLFLCPPEPHILFEQICLIVYPLQSLAEAVHIPNASSHAMCIFFTDEDSC